MTLKMIAEMAGTSVSSVSKAFSGSGEISEETKEKIFRIAKDFGCFEKYYKAPRKQPMIALIVPEIDSEYYGACASVFERAFNRRGADTIIACTRFDAEREARLFRELAYGMKVDSILLWGTGKLIKNHDRIPLVLFGKSVSKNTNADLIRVEYYSAIHTLISTIKDYGHTEVGFFSEGLTRAKQEWFKKAMRSVGLPLRDQFIVLSEKRFAEAGRDCMQTLIDRGELPSVIVTAYDQIAYGAMKRAREAGYKIPDDISFVGIDDIIADTYFDVPLSSIHFDYESVCEEVCDLIFSRIENRYCRTKEKIVVPARVNIRESLRSFDKQNA